MPRHIWMHEVTLAAKCSAEDFKLYDEKLVRERLNRWYDAGEPVWMAAKSLAHMIKRGAIETRADREAAALRARIAGVRDRAVACDPEASEAAMMRDDD